MAVGFGSFQLLATQFGRYAAVGEANRWSKDYEMPAARITPVSNVRHLLDTSALLTLIEDEQGAIRVEELLGLPATIITWMSLLEVAYITRQERDAAEADQRYALLKALPVSLWWSIDEPTLLTAARLKAHYRMSLADTLIAAAAIQASAILVHKDAEFEQLAGEVTLEALPYKPKQARKNN